MLLNSFVWANGVLCKELVPLIGPRYLEDITVDSILDYASGTNEEIATLAPHAAHHYFLDSHFHPENQRPSYRFLKCSASDPIPLADNSLDVVTTNGSFDHFTVQQQVNAFLEIERCLRPGGRLLFGCEYFDFEPEQEVEFFRKTQVDADAISRNVPAFANINLFSIQQRLTSLSICQADQSRLPNGRPLREIASASEAERFRGRTTSGLETVWGAFFVVFEKRLIEG